MHSDMLQPGDEFARGIEILLIDILNGAQRS